MKKLKEGAMQEKMWTNTWIHKWNEQMDKMGGNAWKNHRNEEKLNQKMGANTWNH